MRISITGKEGDLAPHAFLLDLLSGLESQAREAQDAIILDRDGEFKPGPDDKVLQLGAQPYCFEGFMDEAADPDVGVDRTISWTQVRAKERINGLDVWVFLDAEEQAAMKSGRRLAAIRAALDAEAADARTERDVEAAGLDMVNLAARVCGVKPLDEKGQENE